MNLYKNLQKINLFQDSFSPANFTTVPENWFVIITDIIGSTAEIQAGRYKNVNIAGGLSVVALTNGFKDMEFPFIFGGDGVTFLIPPEIIEEATDILLDTKFQIQELYDLKLRIGIVPVKDLVKAGKFIQIGKMSVSKYYDQAIISGNAVETAESWVKKPGSRYLAEKKVNESIKASFEGFTCRWKDVKSSEGETVALIVKVREENVVDVNDYYKLLLLKIMKIAGDESKHHPIKSEFLKTTAGKYLENEAKAVSLQKSGFKFFVNLLRIHMEHIIGLIIITLRLPGTMGYYVIKDIKKYNIISSDYRKYDGTLKMVLSVPEAARKDIELFLQNELDKKNIFYGIHITDRALLTCLVHVGSAKEVHFVDAADGGYALAAQQMKKQMA